MAKPGPKPLPKNVHVLQGNRSKMPTRALFDDKILPATEIPTPPDHLSPEAVEEWERLGIELAKLGLISQIDRAAFAVYCQAYGRWVHAERAIQAAGDKGLITTTPNGFQQMGAWLVISKQAVEQMKVFLIEFGMTPSSRSRVTPSSPQGDLFDDDPSDSSDQAGAKKHDYFG